MHGGAKGSGAPKGNQNAWKHGEYSAENKRVRKRLHKIYGLLFDALDAIESDDDEKYFALIEKARGLGYEPQDGRIAWTEVISVTENTMETFSFEQVATEGDA